MPIYDIYAIPILFLILDTTLSCWAFRLLSVFYLCILITIFLGTLVSVTKTLLTRVNKNFSPANNSEHFKFQDISQVGGFVTPSIAAEKLFLALGLIIISIHSGA